MNTPYIPHILREDEQLFFLHIPKTAGVTFRNILDVRFNLKEICPAYRLHHLLKMPVDVLAGYRLIRGHLPYNIYQLLPQKPTFITLLRDPIARTVSNYEYIRRTPSHPRHEEAKTLSPMDFLANMKKAGRSWENWATYFIGSDFDVRDIYAPRQPNIELACERLSQFTFIGLTERFQDSLNLLSYTFGWPSITNYISRNVAPNRTRVEDFQQATIDLISEMNQLDLQLYAYGKQLFEARFAQMLQDLVEQHYEQHHPAFKHPVRSLHFEFDKVECNIGILGSGWSPAKRHPVHGGVRWTGPGTVSTLDLPLATDGDLAIQFCVLGALAPGIVDSLRLEVNGHPVTLTSRKDERRRTIFEGIITKSMLANGRRFTRLAFHIAHTDRRNGEDRGVAFNWLKVEEVGGTRIDGSLATAGALRLGADNQVTGDAAGSRDDGQAVAADNGEQPLVEHIQAMVAGRVPPGATVLVVSKGDETLLQLDGRQGWHFPQAEEGVYAGYYPADSAEAIAHLEVLRAKGAEYLLFPSPAFWWLEHYEELRQHLDAHYERIWHDAHCIIYRLSG